MESAVNPLTLDEAVIELEEMRNLVASRRAYYALDYAATVLAALAAGTGRARADAV